MWTVARGVIRNPQLSERCVQPVQNVSESEAKGGRLARVATDLAKDQSETKKIVSRGVKYLRWWSRKDRDPSGLLRLPVPQFDFRNQRGERGGLTLNRMNPLNPADLWTRR